MIFKWLGFYVCLILLSSPLHASVQEIEIQSGRQISDLSIGVIQVEASSSSDRLDIKVNVNNEGSELYSNGAITVSYLTGTDLESATILHSEPLPLLFPASVVQLYASFKRADISGNLYVVVDAYNVVAEVDEENNKSVLILADSWTSPDSSFNLVLENTDVLIGESVRIRVNLKGEYSDQSQLFAQISVKNSAGVTVFTSKKSLLRIISEGNAQVDLHWLTEFQDKGKYILCVRIFDSHGLLTNEKRVEVMLVPFDANKPPVAEPDSATTKMNQSVAIDLAVNDVEPDGNRLLFYITQQPYHGQVSELRGLVDYTPGAGFVGVDRFSYQLDDSLGRSDWADVSVNVLPPEQGCTWVRDFDYPNQHEDVAEKGWANYPLLETDSERYASMVLSNDNPDLFEKQPFISFPSCSLYFKAKAGVTGSATVTYVVQDKKTGGKYYTSQERTFEINILPKNAQPLQIISVPETEVEIAQLYTYEPVLSIVSLDEVIALELPNFLSLEGNRVQGSPTASDIGLHKMSLMILSGTQEIVQHYFLTVTPELERPGPILDDGSESPATVTTKPGGFGAGPVNPWILIMGFIVVIGRKKYI